VENECGIRLAFIILLALAEGAGCCRACVAPALRNLVVADPVLAAKGRTDLYACRCTSTVSASPAGSGAARDRLAVAARLFYRSILVLMELDCELAPGTRKIVTFRYDGPVRVTRNLKADLGIAPRVIAPRAIYGGDARAYDVQAEAPDLLMIVDTLLIFSRFRCRPLDTSKDRAKAPRTGKHRRDSAEVGCIKSAETSQELACQAAAEDWGRFSRWCQAVASW
jgi:hypothetical protein